MTRLPLIATACLWLVCALAPDAAAFVRTRSCDPVGEFAPACAPGEAPIEIAWPSPCVGYHISLAGSDDFPQADRLRLNTTLREAINASFEAWNEPSCGALQLSFAGYTCDAQVGYRARAITGGNTNLVLFQEQGWAHPADAVAITSVFVDRKTGEIRDADIELNGQHFTFGALPTDGGELMMDVRNILTHEAGHFLGLDHELAIPDTTMAPLAMEGETSKRALHPDDIAGVCTIYPSDGATPARCRPARLPDRSCDIELEGEIACAQARDAHYGPSPRAPWGLGIVLLAIMILPARLRARRGA